MVKFDRRARFMRMPPTTSTPSDGREASRPHSEISLPFFDAPRLHPHPHAIPPSVITRVTTAGTVNEKITYTIEYGGSCLVRLSSAMVTMASLVVRGLKVERSCCLTPPALVASDFSFCLFCPVQQYLCWRAEGSTTHGRASA